jgi:hypothetical protein
MSSIFKQFLGLAKAILVRHRTLPSTISSRFSDKYHLQIGGKGSTASRSTASWHPKRLLQCVNYGHKHPVYSWIELLKAIQLPYRIPRVQNYLATDPCGPPSTAPHCCNQRANMPKMPPSGPSAFTVHGQTTPGRKEPGSQGYSPTATTLHINSITFFSTLWLSKISAFHPSFP